MFKRAILGFTVSVAAFSAMAENMTEITIYNENLALIKKSQDIALESGVNEVLFNEAARQMKPESAFIFGDGIKVLEQNYDYAGVNYMSMLNAFVGKEVKTVRVNPENGANIFEKAVLVAADGGMPVLKFDYGIETNFPGRVVFDEVPAGLESSPVFKAKVETATAGRKDLVLAYLANGFSWNANYVAKVNDDETLSLLGRASVTNNSGSDFGDVTVNLVAGEVNTVRNALQPRLMRAAMVNTMAKGVMAEAVDAAVIGAPMSFEGYYVYKIPQATSLKDGQIKQVSFLDAAKVKYKKRGVINSTLSFTASGASQPFYKDVHPKVVYNFMNTKEDGLGMPLSKGVISFYDADDAGALQFAGENTIDNKALGQRLTLEIGSFFDVYGAGRIDGVKKVGERKYKKLVNQACPTTASTYEYDVIYEVSNKGKKAVDIVLKQPLRGEAKITSESLKSEKGDGGVSEWRFRVDAGKEQKITAKVSNVLERYGCDDGDIHLQ